MKKNYLFFAIALFYTLGNLNAQSPNWLWAKSIGGPGDDYSKSISVDASGNVYTAGRFWGTTDLDPGAGVFNLTPVGPQDIFVSKLDASGNFVWARSMGGTYGEDCYSIAVDVVGNIYITGDFGDTADFDPGPGVFNLIGEGAFVCKLDNSGNFVWAKAFDGLSKAYSMAVDAFGNVYTTGRFQYTVDFDPGIGTYNLVSDFVGDIFVSKLDSSGNFEWAKAMGGSSVEYGYSVAVNAWGHVYTTGYFRDTADFDPGTGTFNLISAGNTDFFISKLDDTGNFQWAKSIGGINNDQGSVIALDASGNVYTKGLFRDTVDFDPGVGTFSLIAPGLGNGYFTSKLDSSGNFVWAKSMEGLILTIDASANLYIAGEFASTVDFDPGAGIFNLTATGMTADIFVTKFDSSGNFIWAKSAGGTGDEYSYSAAVISATGSLHITGAFYGSFVPFGTTILSNVNIGYPDIFIAKLDTEMVTGNYEIENSGKGVLVFPNPVTNHLTIALPSNSKKVEVTITDITGNIIYSTMESETQKVEVNTKDFAVGIYVVQIQAANFIERKKLIVAK